MWQYVVKDLESGEELDSGEWKGSCLIDISSTGEVLLQVDCGDSEFNGVKIPGTQMSASYKGLEPGLHVDAFGRMDNGLAMKVNIMIFKVRS